MPATYGAAYSALCHTLDATDGDISIHSLLDAGAGTGAAAWAATALLAPETVVCIEPEGVMRRLGQALMSQGPDNLKNAEWIAGDITDESIPYQADLVVASYVVNELDPASRTRTAAHLWNAAKQLLLLIDTGTPDGYAALGKIRTELLALGAHVIAPCTHERECPLPDQDWCHFTCRVPRSALHRHLKGGEAPYEDEKFSFLALSKTAPNKGGARVLRHPWIAKGHVTLEVCTEEGKQEMTYSKKDGEAYKSVRKLKAGELVKEKEKDIYP